MFTGGKKALLDRQKYAFFSFRQLELVNFSGFLFVIYYSVDEKVYLYLKKAKYVKT